MEKHGEKHYLLIVSTGIIDVVVAPENPNVMYAASWERERKAWNFDGDGNNSAIYKSTDAGDTWKNISVNNGFRNGRWCRKNWAFDL